MKLDNIPKWTQELIKKLEKIKLPEDVSKNIEDILDKVKENIDYPKVYEYNLRKEKFTGIGSFDDYGFKYLGEFRDGLFHGKGKYFFVDGSQYEGEWVRGKREGKGIFIYPDGSLYTGEFKNNLPNGTGIYTNKNKLKFEGKWINGNLTGKIGDITCINASFYELDKISKNTKCTLRKHEDDYMTFRDKAIVPEWENNYPYWAKTDRNKISFAFDYIQFEIEPGRTIRLDREDWPGEYEWTDAMTCAERCGLSLPTADQFTKMISLMPSHWSEDDKIGHLKDLADFQKTNYWTSTTTTVYYMPNEKIEIYQDFKHKHQYNVKTAYVSDCRVRCVR